MPFSSSPDGPRRLTAPRRSTRRRILNLRHTHPGVTHQLATESGRLVGYAQLDSGTEAGTGQLVVDPDHRRLGIGTQLVHHLILAATAPLQIWAVGNSAAAQALAARTELLIGRELLIMRRALDGGWPRREVPADLEVRTFEVGRDEPDWLALNARAFRHHPEQGQITRSDLEERFAEPWFDPAGFFVAVRGGSMVGFHWTKQHPDQLGEVYVLGVDPDAGGAGLGKILLDHGLRHLQEQRNTSVILYVEADHERAVGLYQAYGFEIASRDVMYAQRSAAPAAD